MVLFLHVDFFLAGKNLPMQNKAHRKILILHYGMSGFFYSDIQILNSSSIEPGSAQIQEK
jgi:hypothetical protein